MARKCFIYIYTLIISFCLCVFLGAEATSSEGENELDLMPVFWGLYLQKLLGCINISVIKQ
jgi:hypothetical protein